MGIYYLVATAPMTIRLALVSFAAGVFTRLALGVGTTEAYFAWAGPLAAAAFVGGFGLISLAF